MWYKTGTSFQNNGSKKQSLAHNFRPISLDAQPKFTQTCRPK